MEGLDQFLKLFGNITILHVVEFLLACIFLVYVGKKIRDYLIQKHDLEEKKEKDLNEALSAVRKYPEYRKQSIEIQHTLQGEIQNLKLAQKDIASHLKAIEESIREREQNKVRERLIQGYRYYMAKGSWTRMERDSFVALRNSYYKDGGNDYIHSVVEPDMEKLDIIEFE